MKYTLPFFYDYVFANVILPNAMPPEMGVVNYLHTMFSNRLKQQSYFDERFDDENSPWRLMFGHKLGHMPSTLWNNGSYLRMPCFQYLIKVEEDAVYFGKQKRDKYVYPIKITLHFEKFTGTDDVGSRLNGEYFWKHISEEALQDIKNKNAVVFIDWSNENFIEHHQYVDFHDCLRRSGIPPSQVVLAVNSFNAQEVYESWFPPNERRMEVRNLPFLLSNISYYYMYHPESRISEADWRDSQNVHRRNYFVFPIRRAREHRIALLYKIAQAGVLDKGDWSALERAMSPHHILHIANNFNCVADENIANQLSACIPKSLQDETDRSFNTVHGWNDPHSLPMENSYFYIATETYTHGIYKSLTEKVFKPLANYQPFLFMAYPGALQVLRDLGFKTFHPFINEDYDNETSHVKRMEMIVDEIKRLCSMSTNEIHEWYWSMKDILEHNRNHLFFIHQDEKYAEEFVKFLSEKVK